MRVKIWRPQDPRSVAVIKLTVWVGLVTWMAFTLGLSLVFALKWNALVPGLIDGFRGLFITWLGAVWIIFTNLMLVWAVARFAYRRLSDRGSKENG